MSFQDIKKIEDADFYLDYAFRRAKSRAGTARQKLKGTKLERSKTVELAKLQSIADSLRDKFRGIIENFPSIKDMPKFYYELVKCTIDYEALKKGLGAINWAAKTTSEISKKYNEKIKKCQELQQINKYRREYYGRISSIVNQIDGPLKFVEEARKVMKDYPVIKTSLKTYAIAGFPNVGKTTLLSKLTGSKPEIGSYAFTTKGINVAYLKKDKEKVQLLDTPGTLNRFNRMNNIEKQAYLAVKLVADSIIYVFDLTEASYPLKEQKKLLEKLREMKKPITVYIGKADLADKKLLSEFKMKYKALTTPSELKKAIFL